MTDPGTLIEAINSDGRVKLNTERLKKLRKAAGHSQASLALHCQDQRLCISIASIKRAEAGHAVLYRTARHFAACYGVELCSLLVSEHEAQVETCREPTLYRMALPPGENSAALIESIKREIQKLGGDIEPEEPTPLAD